VVQGVDLERLYGIKIIEGSNPSLSVFLFSRLFKDKAVMVELVDAQA